MTGIGINASDKTLGRLARVFTGPKDSLTSEVAHPNLGADDGRAWEGRAIVVFSGANSIPWLFWLRPGFRHCFACIETRGGWMMIDPLKHAMRVELIENTDISSLSRWFERLGLTALSVEIREPPRRLAPVLPITCVEVVKRLIGLQSLRILTPYQLFLYIRKNSLDICL